MCWIGSYEIFNIKNKSSSSGLVLRFLESIQPSKREKTGQYGLGLFGLNGWFKSGKFRTPLPVVVFSWFSFFFGVHICFTWPFFTFWVWTPLVLPNLFDLYWINFNIFTATPYEGASCIVYASPNKGFIWTEKALLIAQML